MAEFKLDDFAGTDSQRLYLAHKAAMLQIPSTVILPAASVRKLRLSTYHNIRPGVSITGDDSDILLDFPGADIPGGNVPYGLGVVGSILTTTSGSVLQGFTIKGRDKGYYRLMIAKQTKDVVFKDIDLGICGQTMIELTDVTANPLVNTIQNVYGPYGGDNSWDRHSAKYKISVIRGNGVFMGGSILGRNLDDHNQSFVTFNNSHNCGVRDNCVFHGTRTYCVNTHGTGSTYITIEDCKFYAGPNAMYGCILVGNEYYANDHYILIRNNEQIGQTPRFLQARENTDYVVVYHNKALDLIYDFSLAYGSARPDMSPNEFGSLHWSMRNNQSNKPAVFGGIFGRYPYNGVSDLDYGDNDMPDPLLQGLVKNVNVGWADVEPEWSK